MFSAFQTYCGSYVPGPTDFRSCADGPSDTYAMMMARFLGDAVMAAFDDYRRH